VDGGIELTHPDLAASLWTNYVELNGVVGVDDDSNGYVDDVHGYSFVNGSANIVPHYHGTHVAGTVAAVNNNGIGVSGVAGGSGAKPGVKIMSCAVFEDSGGLPVICWALPR
jgi:subtilisin family serine protease